MPAEYNECTVIDCSKPTVRDEDCDKRYCAEHLQHFQVLPQGAIVRLKSGGPLMSVLRVNDGAYPWMRDCTWFAADGTLHSSSFPTFVLSAEDAPADRSSSPDDHRVHSFSVSPGIVARGEGASTGPGVIGNSGTNSVGPY